jgi:thiol-disulfide isomerase/thioredoxin
VPTAGERDLCLGERPEEYRLIGKRSYRGRDCYTLESEDGRYQLIVDVRYERLRGIISFNVLHRIAPESYLDWARRFARKPFVTNTELAAWAKTLSPKEGKRFVDAWFREFRQLSSDSFMDNYREVAPGFWFPMKQGYILFEGKKGRSFEAFRREFDVVEIKVNQPLPDSLFTMELREGFMVNDLRGSESESWEDPPLLYPYKKNRSQAEWQAILGAHRKALDQAHKERAARERRIGQAAIDFADSVWLNSKPLRLADLRGKVVVLDFWAVGCGPCRDDLPMMEGCHGRREDTGIVIIGVHVRGNTREEIEKFARERKLAFPIYLDADADSKNDGLGAMTSWFGVNFMPYAVVINREGKVAGYGRLQEVWGKALQLARQKK